MQMMHVKRRLQAEDGFTLMEIVVVVALLAILAAVLTPRLLDTLNSSRSQTAMASGKQLQVAMERYVLEKGAYPVQTVAGTTTRCSAQTPSTPCAVTDYTDLKAALGTYTNLPDAVDAGVEFVSYAVASDSYTLTIRAKNSSRNVVITPNAVK